MTHLPSPLALLVGGGVRGLSLVGAGVYTCVPLAGGEAEAEAREDAAALLGGPGR